MTTFAGATEKNSVGRLVSPQAPRRDAGITTRHPTTLSTRHPFVAGRHLGAFETPRRGVWSNDKRPALRVVCISPYNSVGRLGHLPECTGEDYWENGGNVF